ncbi:sigma 54-interacting transcriptional regulator [Geosporobacter ferrireducens]|uniref:Sigma-54 factor interaction domain-containing protein n=1 Tax=Geosporobacter ferrireducens TaxID=1424294 RepID=A0A1D8GIT2_9FIRM|nr:sigma 54-interacting transcriptional regulator [Geosporobacter ferrireducens]AOT70825.1 hypothetical protein Gferi_15440 [Geosporobacter ferrireducens]
MITINNIIDSVKELAEATRAAFKIDVMVVDSNKTIIVATGMLESMLNNKIIESGIINREMFQHRQKYFILTNPQNDHICVGCDRYQKTCIYKNVVATTIYNGDTIAGVISINAITEDQRAFMANNEQNILDFLIRISHLLSAKLSENKMIRELKKNTAFLDNIYNKINKGILITTLDYKVIKTNDYMKKMLSLEDSELLDTHVKEIFPDLPVDGTIGNLENPKYNEISRNVNGQRKFFLYTATSIFLDGNIEAIIYIFEDPKAFNNILYQISAKSNCITLDDIIGEDSALIEFKKKIKKISLNDSTVLLCGETGTGKELFARAIHNESPRSSEPFIAINCAAIPETLIESELFGYEKGTFTGALTKGKHGKFYLADKGTIFLDEVESMPLYLQQKLLRFIERKEIERIGSNECIAVDVRIVSATNIDLYEMVKRKEFREDLFHRLNVVGLFIPPLRERGRDPLVLANFFIEKFNKKFNKNILGLSKEAEALFLEYDWSGNVRELQNSVEYAINMETSEYIKVNNLPANLRSYKKVSSNTKQKTNIIALEASEKANIINALNLYGYNDKGIIKAAKKLGISRSTLYRRIAKYQIKQ